MLSLLEAHTPRRRLLEIGPAGGDFLRGARARGWQVTGVEISAEAAQAARDNFALDVRTGELLDAGFPAESFDVVYMGDVLEHVPDPCGHLREVHRILAPSGLVVVAGPTTIHSLTRRIGLAVYAALARTRTLATPPYHIWEFTPSTLTQVVEAAGFTVRAARAAKIPPPALGRCSRVVDAVWLWPVEWLNVAVTKLTGRCGDRLVLVAAKDAGTR